MISLITIVGIDHLHLLDEFIDHYKKLSINKFCICVHIAPGLDKSERSISLLRTDNILQKHGIDLHAVYYGEFYEDLIAQFKDQIRCSLDLEDDWIVWCDADELQEYSASIQEVISELTRKNSYALGGVMFDRVRRSSSAIMSSDASLWQRYPVGVNITQFLIGAVVQKIVIAHRNVKMGLGNHFVENYEEGLTGGRPVDYTVPIHHFKWDDAASDRLRLRLTDEQKARHTWWWQFARTLDWLAQDSFAKDNLLELVGLDCYDFADDISELGAGPFSRNLAYTGGPYWTSYQQVNRAERPDPRVAKLREPMSKSEL